MIGQIGGPFGVAGWVRVRSFTDPSDNLLAYMPWQLQLQHQPSGAQGAAPGHTDWEFVDAEARAHHDGFVARIGKAADRAAAALFRGARIGVSAEVLPATEADEYYWRELIGLRVIAQRATADAAADAELGRVTRVFATPAHDVLVVASDGDERLIPFVRRVVVAVDVEAGRILVDWAPDWR